MVAVRFHNIRFDISKHSDHHLHVLVHVLTELVQKDKDVLEWLTNEELDGSDFVITSFSRKPIEVKLSLDKTTNIVSARSVYDTDGNLMIPNVRTDTLYQ